MRKLWLPASVITLAGFGIIGGCNPSAVTDTTGSDANGSTNTDNSTTDADTSGDNSANDTNSYASSTGLSLSGTISAPAKYRARSEDKGDAATFGVVLQSVETQETYQGTTDASGNFAVDLPQTEKGSTFMVTIVNPDGQSMGTMVFGKDNSGMGLTGVSVLGDASLGTIDVPATPGSAPVEPGSDKNLDSAPVSEDVKAHLNADGAPAGAGNLGKGDDSLVAGASSNKMQVLDKDQDGLIDFFDADDDGNGKIDELDTTSGPDKFESEYGIRFYPFMNLKIDDADSSFYFTGDTANIEKSLKEDTVITFDLTFDGRGGKKIKSAAVLSSPAPAFLAGATLFDHSLWSSVGYALNDKGGGTHFDQFVHPNDFINGGDAFTLLVEFDDGSKMYVPRMINFVFKSIPKLNFYGSPSAPTRSASPSSNQFDGTQDLVLKWNPPVDEAGKLLVGFDYRFEVFFNDAGGQQIQNIDGAATWPTLPSGWRSDVRSFDVQGSSLSTLDGSNQLSVQLPSGIFVNTVQTSSGPVNVASYTIDIAAQKNGNNAALKVRFVKQP